jgi:hypothetical protein
LDHIDNVPLKKTVNLSRHFAKAELFGSAVQKIETDQFLFHKIKDSGYYQRLEWTVLLSECHSHFFLNSIRWSSAFLAKLAQAKARVEQFSAWLGS